MPKDYITRDDLFPAGKVDPVGAIARRFGLPEGVVWPHVRDAEGVLRMLLYRDGDRWSIEQVKTAAQRCAEHLVFVMVRDGEPDYEAIKMSAAIVEALMGHLFAA